MRAYEDIRKQLSEMAGEDSPHLELLDAFICDLMSEPAVSAERAETALRKPYSAGEYDLRVEWLHHRQNQDTGDMVRLDYEWSIAAAEQTTDTFLASTRFSFRPANILYPDIVDALLKFSPLENAVQMPGARLLVVHSLNAEQPVLERHIPLFGYGSFDVCDGDDKFNALLSKEDGRLFVFGIGSGFVTDRCLYAYGAAAREMMPATDATVKMLKEDVERMAREGWVRITGDHGRIWRRPDER